LTLLRQIALATNGTHTFDELVRIVELEIATILPSDSSYLATYHADSDTMDFLSVIERGARVAPFRRQPGHGLLRQLILGRCAVRMNERSEDPDADTLSQNDAAGPAMRSWLGVPMRLDERVIGVVSLQAVRPNAFSEQDAELLQAIADQVAPLFKV